MKRPYVGSTIVPIGKDGEFTLSPYMWNRAMERSPNRTLFIGPSLHDTCLMLYDESSIPEILRQSENCSWVDGVRYFSLLEAVILGSGGKIHPPAIVRASGYFDDTMLIVAAGDHLELWNPEIAAAHRDPYISCAAAMQSWLTQPEADRQTQPRHLAILMEMGNQASAGISLDLV